MLILPRIGFLGVFMQETGKIENPAVVQIMKAVHEYGIACVNMHIRQRESGFGSIMDEHKHQQAVWCAIRDMINIETEMLMDACEEHAKSAGHWSRMYKEAIGDTSS
jgi:hypothetical protein